MYNVIIKMESDDFAYTKIMGCYVLLSFSITIIITEKKY